MLAFCARFPRPRLDCVILSWHLYCLFSHLFAPVLSPCRSNWFVFAPISIEIGTLYASHWSLGTDSIGVSFVKHTPRWNTVIQAETQTEYISQWSLSDTKTVRLVRTGRFSVIDQKSSYRDERRVKVGSNDPRTPKDHQSGYSAAVISGQWSVADDFFISPFDAAARLLPSGLRTIGSIIDRKGDR